jgi:hypothetical protein
MAHRPPRRSGGQAAFEQKINQIQSQPEIITPSAGFISAATPLIPGDIYWRMGRGQPSGRTRIAGMQSGTGAGNVIVTSDPRGEYAARPGAGAGDGIANVSPYPVAVVQTPHSLDSAGAHARTPAFQHGKLIARDRHIIAKRGRTTSSADEQRTGANPNPEADGPARPSWKMFNRSISFQIGTDNTRNLDNHDYHATTETDDGKPFPLATQGQQWSIKYGGTPYLANFRPYGSRSGFSEGAPLPTVYSEAGGPYARRTLLQVGAAEDGPQKIYGGLPYGLHSPTTTARGQIQSMVRSRLGQVKPVWANRPSNSRSAGQSWSQSMVSLSGRQAVKLTRATPTRMAGLHSRYLGS